MLKKAKIKDLGTIITGRTPSTKNDLFWNGEIDFITPKDIQVTKHIFKTERSLSYNGMNAVASSLLPANAICVSCIGYIGYVGMTTKRSVTNQQINSIICNQDNDPNFVFYLMKSLWSRFKKFEGQSTTISILNKGQFSDIDISLPSLQEQKKIAAQLSCIDEKIELNAKINDNLEQQILSLYEHLFVTQKEDYWKEGALGDIGTIVGGGTPSKSRTEYYAENGIAWITPKDLSINKSKYIYRGGVDISDLGFKKSSASLVPAGTVLFSSRAPIGYIAIAGQELTTNQGFKSVIPSKTIGTSFIYCFLKKNLPLIESMSSGSTFKEISGSSMKQVPVTIPSNKSLDLFNQYVNPLFDKQKILEKENSTLAEIRDTLLLKFFG